jgi:tetratricopeptide (TPR) repeat protein
VADPDKTRIARVGADTTEPGAGDTVDEPGAEHHPSPPPPRKGSSGTIVALGLIGLALLVAFGSWEFQREKTPDEVKPAIVEVPAESEVPGLLAKARQCLDSDDESPKWDACDAAAKRVLDINPIDRDGNEVTQKLTAERAAFETLRKGTQALTMNRVEDAFELYEKVPHGSHYFLKAYDQAQRALPDARKMWSERCKKYASAGKWPQAEVDCGWYLRTTCEQLGDEEILGPPLVAHCTKPKQKACWTPKNENVARLYEARLKLDPNAATWMCPKLPLYREAKATSGPAAPVVSFPDSAIDKAFGPYLKGDPNASVLELQKLQEKTENAAQHAQARSLQRDIAAIDGLVKTGRTQIDQGKFEEAAKNFEEALALDAKLAKTTGQGALRKTVLDEVASAAVTRAGPLMDRNDVRGACRALKIGFHFSKSNIDLLNAVSRCTMAASEALKSANDCAALDQVLELAVENDGIAEKATAAKQAQSCP